MVEQEKEMVVPYALFKPDQSCPTIKMMCPEVHT